MAYFFRTMTTLQPREPRCRLEIGPSDIGIIFRVIRVWVEPLAGFVCTIAYGNYDVQVGVGVVG